MLALLLSILTATVTSYNSVTLSGDIPQGVTADYIQVQNTHYKGRLLQGEKAQLVLSGLKSGYLRSASVSVHSNKTGGGGTLDVNLASAQSPYWRIADAPFSASAWYGSFTSDFVTISHTATSAIQSGDVLTFEIKATSNSLYVQSFTIDYTAQPLQPYSLTLLNGDETEVYTEQYAGQGIELPIISSIIPGWHFVGWTTTEIPETTDCPDYFEGGTIFYPAADEMLYALYSNAGEEEVFDLYPATELVSGVYAIYCPLYNVFCRGDVNSKRMAADTLPLSLTFLPIDYRYQIDIQPDNAITIYHPASETFVGFNGANHYLTAEQSHWNWMAAADESFYIYHQVAYSDDTYALWPQPTQAIPVPHYADCDVLYAPEYTYLQFLPVESVPTAVADYIYMSNPNLTGIRTIEKRTIDWSLPVRIYSLTGKLIYNGIYHHGCLPAMPYIVKQ